MNSCPHASMISAREGLPHQGQACGVPCKVMKGILAVSLGSEAWRGYADRARDVRPSEISSDRPRGWVGCRIALVVDAGVPAWWVDEGLPVLIPTERIYTLEFTIVFLLAGGAEL